MSIKSRNVHFSKKKLSRSWHATEYSRGCLVSCSEFATFKGPKTASSELHSTRLITNNQINKTPRIYETNQVTKIAGEREREKKKPIVFNRSFS